MRIFTRFHCEVHHAEAPSQPTFKSHLAHHFRMQILIGFANIHHRRNLRAFFMRLLHNFSDILLRLSAIATQITAWHLIANKVDFLVDANCDLILTTCNLFQLNGGWS
jgi:hypothetical protein